MDSVKIVYKYIYIYFFLIFFFFTKGDFIVGLLDYIQIVSVYIILF